MVRANTIETKEDKRSIDGTISVKHTASVALRIAFCWPFVKHEFFSCYSLHIVQNASYDEMNPIARKMT